MALDNKGLSTGGLAMDKRIKIKDILKSLKIDTPELIQECKDKNILLRVNCELNHIDLHSCFVWYTLEHGEYILASTQRVPMRHVDTWFLLPQGNDLGFIHPNDWENLY